IVDDGVGFDPASVRRGQGLHNIEDRARRLDGTLTIVPANGKGTRHLVTIPVERKDLSDG
ncbi:MAG: sensor histidine kinase, partial [Gaiellales bacterium]